MIPFELLFIYLLIAAALGSLIGWKAAKKIFTQREILRMAEAIQSVHQIRSEQK